MVTIFVNTFHTKQIRRKRPPMRIRGRFFCFRCFLFAEEIHKNANLLKYRAFLFAQKIRSGMSEKPTNQFEDAHDLIFSYIDTKKNTKIFCGYKKHLYICSIKRCGDFRKTLKNE